MESRAKTTDATNQAVRTAGSIISDQNTAALGNRTKDGGIVVYQPELHEELARASEATGNRKAQKTSRKVDQDELHRKQLRQEKLQAIVEARRAGVLEEDRKIRTYVEQKLGEKEKNFERLLESLDYEKELLEDVERYLEYFDHCHMRKQADLHEEWERSVYDSIQNQICHKLSKSCAGSEIEKRRRTQYEEYLKASFNKRVFNDVIVPSEYDPFKHNKSLRYNVSESSDPLKRDLNRLKEEKKTIRELSNQPLPADLPSGGREILALQHWDDLQSTPYGRYSKFSSDDPDAVPVLPRQYKAQPRSSVVMDHFRVTTDPEVARAEYFAKGKKVFPDKQPQSQF